MGAIVRKLLPTRAGEMPAGLAGVDVCDSIGAVYRQTEADPSVNTETPESSRKSQIDALLLALPGVSARKINNLDAYFVSDKMFACISGDGIGLRLPATTATELQFSRDNVVPFQPGGVSSTREWIQINRADATEYSKDLELFQASLDFVKTGRTR